MLKRCWFLLVLITTPSQAHDWYEWDCCDNDDCRPAKQGEVIEQNGGFSIIPTGEHFKYEHDNVRYMAPDGLFHVCQYSTSAGDYQENVPIWVTRCLYVPGRAM